MPPWHEPLVQRPQLSQDAIRRIASFVSSSLLATLVERSDLDEETAKIVQENVQRRLQETDDDPEAAEQRRAEMLFDRGRLDDQSIITAAEAGQRAFVIKALSLLAKCPADVARRMLDSRTGRVVAALCWKADLSMLTATAVQRHIAAVPEQTLVVDGGGNSYPLTETEMDWFVDYFRTANPRSFHFDGVIIVPTPCAVNISNSNTCGMRPSIMWAAAVPFLSASRQVSILGIIPPVIALRRSKPLA